MHINGHECLKDIELIGATTDVAVTEVLLPPGASVAQVSFIESFMSSPEIEVLMDVFDSEDDVRDLIDVPTW